jgi:hypothetical protein
MKRFASLLPLLLTTTFVAGCSRSALDPPSLAPRAAESIDPRLPVEHKLVEKPADPNLRRQLDALVAEARAGDGAFQTALGPAERAASAAGAAQSEGWIAAQEALSALEAARAPTARAVASIDALTGDRIHSVGDLGASDRAMIEQAEHTVRALDERQSARIKALTGRLGR